MNDGGLFFAMMRAIQLNGPALPELVTYNGELIPFAYPPLALYLGAFVAGDDSPIAALRWLPIVASILTIPAAYAVCDNSCRLSGWQRSQQLPSP